MKKISRKSITILCGLLLTLVVSCVKEDYSNCPTSQENVRIYFNPTTDDTARAKTLWQTERIDLFIFDQQGLFYSRLQDTDVIWSPAYYLSTDLPTGTYTFVAWTNLKDSYYTQPQTFIKGSTTLAQAMTLLAPSQANGLIDFTPKSLYFGRQTQVSVNAEQQTLTTIPLIENTYRINFIVKGLEATDHNYNFSISDTNIAYYFDNTFAPSQEAIYLSSCQMNAQSELITSLTTLRIDRTRHPILKISDSNTGEKLFETDLVSMILKLEEQGVPVDFDVTHTFNLVITLSRNQAGVTAQVSINGWVLFDEDGKLD